MSEPKPRSDAERFWESVDKRETDECWVWTGHRKKSGYGLFSASASTDAPRRQLVASRVSYELNVGPIPDGLLVCHRCDNPPCVNPAHLFVGSHKDNMQDALTKGRLRQPDPDRTHCRHGHELTDENVQMQGHLKMCRQCKRDATNRHYARTAELVRAKTRAHYQTAKDKIRARARKYYHEHREEQRERMRAYYHQRKAQS